MKILQFGGGNFLRCFFDWMLQKVSDATGIPYEVTLVQLTEGEPVFEIAECGGYHTLLRGYDGDEYVETLDEVRVIRNAVSPFTDPDAFLEAGLSDIELVVSNSTEAGIFHDPTARAPHNYPSFLALLLNARARRGLPPIMIMAMELNDRSGDLLKKNLTRYGESLGYGDEFNAYVAACTFYNTLVDRIVPGYPADAAERVFERIGRVDPWLTSGERFHLFVIEGDKKILEKIPFDRAGLNVVVTDDKLDFYHDRKVRILNGAHTSSVPVALLSGVERVDEFASHPRHAPWLKALMHDEICAALDDAAETHAYADEVLARFRNPALGHSFRSIALNSVAKCDARLTPTLRDFHKKYDALPPKMTEAVRKMFALYGDGPVATLPGGPLALTDYAQLRGTTPDEMAASFFPSLPAAAREAIAREIA